MPQLKKASYERFAIAYAELGASEEHLATAYRQAGYAAATNTIARTSALRLIRIAEISARVRELQAEINERVRESLPETVDKAVQSRAGRITILAADLAATNRIIAERAIEPDYQDAPGGKTGRIVVGWAQKGTVKTVDEKGRATITPEYYKTHAYDTKLVERRQALLDQIAGELGQRIDKKQQVPMTVDELKQSPAFEQFLEAAAKEAERLGYGKTESDKKAVDELEKLMNMPVAPAEEPEE